MDTDRSPKCLHSFSLCRGAFNSGAPACVIGRKFGFSLSAAPSYNFTYKTSSFVMFSSIFFPYMGDIKAGHFTSFSHTRWPTSSRELKNRVCLIERTRAAMIFRNLGPSVPIIKVAWEKTIAVSKLFCFLHITNTYVISPVVTYGPSMLPTIELRPNVFLMEKISTRFGKIACGDIVVLRHPQDPRRFMTKRVVGLEGDSVTYISDPENNDKPKTTVVPKGGVWLEGDNKYKSNDSRKFGHVPYGLIQGKMFWKILPLNDIGPFWDK